MIEMHETIIGAFGVGFSACGTAIIVMWRKLSRDHRLLEERANQLSDQNAELNEKLTKQGQRIGELSGLVKLFQRCTNEDCPFREYGHRARRDMPYDNPETQNEE